MDDDYIDGCDFTKAREPTTDDDLAALVLFAACDFESDEAVARRKAEWTELFGGV